MIALAWAVPIPALTKEQRLILWVSVLVGVLVVGGVIMARVDAWRKRQMADKDDSPEHLGSFRAMYERGELSKEEYDKVLRRMAVRVGAKPKPESAPTNESATQLPDNQEPPATPPA
jgi:hypothetical protein